VASGATARSSTAPASHRASTSSTSFPVLSVGTTPHTPLDAWTFGITGAIDEPVAWTWEEVRALPAETPTPDIHCVTAWSKLDTTWTGVSIDTLLAGLKTEADQVSAWCDDGYRTNLRLEDVTGGRAWIAYEYGASLGVVVIGLGVLLRDLLLALLGAIARPDRRVHDPRDRNLTVETPKHVL
jgi:DMSO/TMAO reductase YedYZ molybdopterin-dependent catalytic subunit